MSKSTTTTQGVLGDIDTTYHTQQRDMFASGLAAEIGVNAFAVWHAIKSHADFHNGRCWPGIRRLMLLTGLSTDPVQAGVRRLVECHLLRIVGKRRQTNVYIARERLDVRVGDRVICTVVIDFVPATMRSRLARLKGATAGRLEAADIWSEVELIPGPGLKLDPGTGTFKTLLRADEIPAQAAPAVEAEASGRLGTPAEARARLKQLADEIAAAGARSSRKRAPAAPK